MALGITSSMLLSMSSGIPTADDIAAMSDQDRKVFENRLRRAAERQGLRLEKSRLRDVRAIGYGTYQLVDESGSIVAQADEKRGYGLGLRDIARHLFGGDSGR